MLKALHTTNRPFATDAPRVGRESYKKAHANMKQTLGAETFPELKDSVS